MPPPWGMGVTSNEQTRLKCLYWPVDRNKHVCKTLWQFVTLFQIFRIRWAMGQCRVSPWLVYIHNTTNRTTKWTKDRGNICILEFHMFLVSSSCQEHTTVTIYSGKGPLSGAYKYILGKVPCQELLFASVYFKAARSISTHISISYGAPPYSYS